MTHPIHIEDQFSELFDGSLSEEDQARARGHLAKCEACRASYASFEEATAALGSLRLTDTPAAHVDEVMSALAPAFSAGPSLWHRAGRILTHAAALLVGVGLAWTLRGEGGLEESDTNTPPRVVEVVREVPTEVIREVPVEVVRSVWVERIEYVDRPLPSSWQPDERESYELVAHLARALSDVAHVAVAESARREASRASKTREHAPASPIQEPLLASASPPESPGPRPSRQNHASSLADAPPIAGLVAEVAGPVRILRTDGRVRIRTRGPLADVVPALIDTLDDTDNAVSRAAEQHLESLRAELFGGEGAAPLLARGSDRESQAKRPADRLLGLFTPNAEPEEDLPAPDPHTTWTDWWLDHSPTLAASDVH